MNPIAAWLREQLNRPRRWIPPDALPFEVVEPSPGETRALNAHPLFDPGRGSEPDLLIVLTTCLRVEATRRTLDGIARCVEQARQEGLGEVAVLVLEDAAEADYEPVREAARASLPGLVWVRSARRMGKKGYWATCQVAYLAAEATRAKQLFFVQDDLEFEDSMLVEGRRLLRGARADGSPSEPVVLSLFASDDDEENGRWIHFPRRPLNDLPVRQTQWFDLPGYLTDRDTLELLGYRIIPVPGIRWKRNPRASSGVGRQLTRRLHRRARIYQCYPPLIFHGSSDSVMNPDTREDRPMDNRTLRDSP